MAAVLSAATGKAVAAECLQCCLAPVEEPSLSSFVGGHDGKGVRDSFRRNPSLITVAKT
jgi:hypothetical protein